MKFINYIMAAVTLLVSAPATASVDDVVMDIDLGAHQTRLKGVDIQSGHSIIDVFAVDGTSKFNCKYIDVNGDVVLAKNNVSICRGDIDLKLPWRITVKVFNLEDKPIKYRIHVFGK